MTEHLTDVDQLPARERDNGLCYEHEYPRGGMSTTVWKKSSCPFCEIQRLRTALTGISTCSTCEACRGAALRALGHQSNPVVAQSGGGGCDIRPEHRPSADVVEQAAQGEVAGSSPAHGASLLPAGEWKLIGVKRRSEDGRTEYIWWDTPPEGTSIYACLPPPPGDGRAAETTGEG